MPIPRLSSSLSFPDPRGTAIDGLLAIGGDLRFERLLEAYKRGIFPWYSEGQPILWFSPDPRMVLYPNRYRCPNSLQRLLKSKKFDVRIDSDFAGVIRSCAATPRRGQSGTWITEDMIESYIELHRRGYGHSFEAYLNNQLVGGLYGVSIGKAFFGESMFHTVPNASKVAFDHLVRFCLRHDFLFVDAQTPSEHLRSLGAEEIDRELYLSQLQVALECESIIGQWDLDGE